jgi:hypothetical protein
VKSVFVAVLFLIGICSSDFNKELGQERRMETGEIRDEVEAAEDEMMRMSDLI